MDPHDVLTDAKPGITDVDRLMYTEVPPFYEAIELGMRSAKAKPLTKKERAEKRKRKKEKRAAKK